MGVTLYVDGWNEQPCTEVRRYLCDEYPSFSESDFLGQGYQCDENGRHFVFMNVYTDPFPQADFSGVSWELILCQLGLRTEFGVGDAEPDQIPELVRKCVRILNSQEAVGSMTSNAMNNGKHYVSGYDEIRVRGCFESALKVFHFASQHRRGVYWG